MLWTILRRFGYEDTYNDSLKADTTEGTKLKNFMTLEEAIHDAFDDMELWYETVPSEANCYRDNLALPSTHQGLGVPERSTIPCP
ncbi:uncharacterized protein C8Q71DRAFT_733120 [Rhodofomes roseus]|uniref:RNase H type-1 domain-containing protein n=1 Tax=Rhodofomes roseus TaxID=34475 RepID=A0ABQ8KVE0_9APHY|nr:uncharacterized protein C8Q71DRAFT_733120 [Rhodofomes roseus]KAH9842499.1 hypothetical protein C8Q71DRAFT_733120 [Rhodofomes roseus]